MIALRSRERSSQGRCEARVDHQQDVVWNQGGQGRAILANNIASCKTQLGHEYFTRFECNRVSQPSPGLRCYFERNCVTAVAHGLVRKMEALEKRIEDLVEFRDDFFVRRPSASAAERAAAIREAAMPMIQDIPLETPSGASSKAQYNLLCGRILNVCVDYDARCEDYLSRAVKFSPQLSDAWYELGECLWKKPDRQGAIDCFQRALTGARRARVLCALSMGLRAELSASTSTDAKRRCELLDESSALAEEAVALEPQCGAAWHAVGNARLARFFARAQNEPSMLGSALHAYEKALTLDREERNADLHFNYAQALRYDQRYDAAVRHLRRAAELDPGFPDPRERLLALNSYLSRTQQSVRLKGKLKAKRLAELIRSISSQDLGIYSNPSLKLNDGTPLRLAPTTYSQLLAGANRNCVVSGRVVGIVTNEESIPYTFTACDADGTCLAFTVFNFSPQFGVVIGDAIACPEPFVIDVKVEDGDLKESIDFRLVRVSNPSVLIRNWKKIGIDQVAFCNIRCDSKPSAD